MKLTKQERKAKPEPHFPPPTLASVPPNGRIKITRPILETGEILVEGSVPPTRFKPKRPSPPKHPELAKPRISPCWSGWSTVHMIDYRESQIVFWEAHKDCLTREERSDLANERSTSILRPIEPEWKIGDRLPVASNVEAEVLDVVKSRRGYGTVFRVHDHRVLYLKRAADYTTSPTQAVSEAGAVMDEGLHNRLHPHVSAERAIKGTKKRKMGDRDRLEAKLERAKAKGWDSSVRRYERILKHHEAKEARMASVAAA